MIRVRNLPKNVPYCIGFSSGVDSLAATHLLIRLGYKISLCHFNHYGEDQDLNDKMEEAARQFAIDHKVPIYIGGNMEQVSGGNLEDRFRKSRIDFFKKMPHDIIVCHHLDDAIESFFAAAMQGKGDRCPIPIKTKLTNTDVSIIRPFMLTPKNEFEQYVNRNGLSKYLVFDTSNLNTEKYRRNYIRFKILPIIPKALGLKNTVKKQMEHFYKKAKDGDGNI